ncbi:hypothetical protein [Phytohabitans rumicis]|uniref:Uncharacterized protein n=1 Tax=Phytohabitans rumicis TaxID=1076125 RepID=A0A6V8L5R1_9ACTN|nr:hypothetical protein [Phytohabitans rumicis]GFJ91564.1 hypothetical protein Prum_052060 [Phytohabitans rumicis]
MSLDLDAIRARLAAATAGPWRAHPDGLVWADRPGDPVSGSTEVEDAEFIAHARTDVPALLAELDEGWARLVTVERVFDAIREHYIRCRLSHPTNEDWFGCEARAVAAALTPQVGGNGEAVKRDAGGPAPRGGGPL